MIDPIWFFVGLFFITVGLFTAWYINEMRQLRVTLENLIRQRAEMLMNDLTDNKNE